MWLIHAKGKVEIMGVLAVIDPVTSAVVYFFVSLMLALAG